MWVSDDSIIEYGAIMSMQSNAPIQGVSYLYQKPKMHASVYTRSFYVINVILHASNDTLYVINDLIHEGNEKTPLSLTNAQNTHSKVMYANTHDLYHVIKGVFHVIKDMIHAYNENAMRAMTNGGYALRERNGGTYRGVALGGDALNYLG